MHITLKFLGNTPQEVLDKAAPKIERAFQAKPACQLDLQDVGYFPDDRRPRVVWVGISPGSVVAEWANIVEEILNPLGYPREQRPFHLTPLTLHQLFDFLGVELLLGGGGLELGWFGWWIDFSLWVVAALFVLALVAVGDGESQAMN